LATRVASERTSDVNRRDVSLHSDVLPSFGAFLSAVAHEANGHPDADRLLIQAAAGLNEQVPSEAGYLVPLEWASEMWDRVRDRGALFRLCDRQPVSGAG